MVKLYNVSKDEKEAYEKEADKQNVALDVRKELVILLEMKEQTPFSTAKLELHLKLTSLCFLPAWRGLWTFNDYSNKVPVYSNLQLILANINFKSVGQ